MIVKRHVAEGRVVLAICDDYLLGNVYRVEGLVLDLSASFYAGEKMDKEEVLDFLKEANAINAVGSESVQLLIDEGYVKEDQIIKIADIPHVQVAK